MHNERQYAPAEGRWLVKVGDVEAHPMLLDQLGSDKGLAQESTRSAGIGRPIAPNELCAIEGLIQEQAQHLHP